MKLDYSPLENAVFQLQKSYTYLHSELAEDEELCEQFRAATIQAFEFTYAMAIKMIKRQLSMIVAAPDELDGMTFMNLMREAAQARLIRDPEIYKFYRELRNRTSHTYDCIQAEVVIDSIDEFLESTKFLLKELTRRNS